MLPDKLHGPVEEERPSTLLDRAYHFFFGAVDDAAGCGIWGRSTPVQQSRGTPTPSKWPIPPKATKAAKGDTSDYEESEDAASLSCYSVNSMPYSAPESSDDSDSPQEQLGQEHYNDAYNDALPIPPLRVLLESERSRLGARRFPPPPPHTARGEGSRATSSSAGHPGTSDCLYELLDDPIETTSEPPRAPLSPPGGSVVLSDTARQPRPSVRRWSSSNEIHGNACRI